MLKKPLAIYVHWPFCVSKCPYCDFNSHVREKIDTDAWKKALLQDLLSFKFLSPAFEVTSIFFGGGTPSLMPEGIIESILSTIANFYEVSSTVEITLEANPNSTEAKKFQSIAAMGVNRLSLGIQSLVEENLKFLGRSHSIDDAMRAIALSEKFFKNRSFDLIYTLPHQSLASWQDELKHALTLAGPHLSLYQLTIEEGTPFYLAAHRKDFIMPSEEQSALFFEWTHNYMGKHGYPAYEVSNFAVPGRECHHNKHYWYYEDYIGIGPGAHGRVTLEGKKYAIRRHRFPEKWLETIQMQGDGLHEKWEVKEATLVKEYLLMRLRLLEGFSLKEFKEKTGVNFFEHIPQERVNALQQAGLLHKGEAIKPTFEGIKRLNSVLRFLLGNSVL